MTDFLVHLKHKLDQSFSMTMKPLPDFERKTSQSSFKSALSLAPLAISVALRETPS